MITVGITGNAGSGKSTVAEAWRERGAAVLDADELAREVLDRDRDLRRALAIEFGEHILEPSASADTGAVRREELARCAFASPERTRALNRLVHPPILALMQERFGELRARNERVVAVDAALIFEAGAESLFDRIVLVTAPPAVRIQRLRGRGWPEAIVAGVIAGQTSDAVKVDRADHVIRNEGSPAELRAAALEVLDRILSSAPETPPSEHDVPSPARTL